MRRVYAAIARPFRPAPVDYETRRVIERRQREIERQLDRLMELRFQANVQGRKEWEQQDGWQSWSG